MNENNEYYHKNLMMAVRDADDQKMDELIMERNLYIDGIESDLLRKETLEYFLIKDQEAYNILVQKRADIQSILLNQSTQQKVIEKYEKF